MILLIDLATMAVMHPGGIPVTDLSLVRGDKLPLRITLLDEGTPVTPSGTRPALAVKTALGDDTLVLAATNLEPVDDALGLAYVGSLSVNTTQLIAAMGSADRIDLVAEVVIIDGDGSQRTSSLIKVRVRQDIMPADVVPPDDVIVNWRRWWPHPWPTSCQTPCTTPACMSLRPAARHPCRLPAMTRTRPWHGHGLGLYLAMTS